MSLKNIIASEIKRRYSYMKTKNKHNNNPLIQTREEPKETYPLTLHKYKLKNLKHPPAKFSISSYILV